jgi:thioredoxin-like negative regulator of GroEL
VVILSEIFDIDVDSFDEVVKGSDVTAVLEFWIRSCSFCQKFKPVYEKLPGIYGGRVKFFRMNMMKSIENLRLAEGMGVEQTPTTKVFCGGREVGEIVGFKQLDETVKDLNTILDSKSCRS